MASLLFAVAAYLIGSISFAVVVSALFGLKDPRTYGSKNPGATNVLRSGNKVAAIVTLAGDCAKGWLAVFLADMLGPRFGVGETGIALCALAVFLGHLWPVFFRFVGGKGVATALGVLLAVDYKLGLATAATWVIIAFFFRYSSLAAIISALFAPFYYFFGDGEWWELTKPMTVAICAMSALLIYRHRKNISNLLAGKEGKLGSKKTG